VSLLVPRYPASGQATVSAKTWQSSCTRPGEDLTRQRLAGAEILDSDELWEKAKRDTQARSDAFRAAQGWPEPSGGPGDLHRRVALTTAADAVRTGAPRSRRAHHGKLAALGSARR
jgi:hypothetical protein